MHVDSRTRRILIAIPSSCFWRQPPRSRRRFGPDAFDAAMASNILWGHVGSVASAVLVGTKNRLLFRFFLFFIVYCILLQLRRMGQAMSTATCPWKFIPALSSTPLSHFLSFVVYCIQLLLHHMGRAMSIVTRLWKFIAALNSTPLSFFLSFIIICVLLRLHRMGKAMSTATCPWKYIAALNSTPLSFFHSFIIICVLLHNIPHLKNIV